MVQYNQKETQRQVDSIGQQALYRFGVSEKGRYSPMNDNKNNEISNEKESNIITLTDEDGKEIDFEVIGDAEIDGTVYYAMAPVGAVENNEGIIEYVLLKLIEDEEGEEVFVTVDDEDEFDKVADFFDDMFDSEEDYDA
jgi:uncharacterized protein YrzB (UPF0473 family)